MKIAVLLSSRGLINSRTIESVLKNLKHSKFEWEIFFSHNLPIPDAQNETIRQALSYVPDFFWFVEEDNLIPDKTLVNMVIHMERTGSGVVSVDYPQGASAKESGVVIKDGNVLWTAFGCMLVKDYVFSLLEYPWIRNDKTWVIKDPETFELEEKNVPNKYGGQDIQFGMALNKLGVKISVLPGVIAGHIKMTKEGKAGSNKGTHEFVVYDKIENIRIYGR